MTLFLFMGRGGCFELRLSMPLSRHGDRIDGKHPLMRKKRLAAEVAFARQRAVFFRFQLVWTVFGRRRQGLSSSTSGVSSCLPLSLSLARSLARFARSARKPTWSIPPHGSLVRIKTLTQVGVDADFAQLVLDDRAPSRRAVRLGRPRGQDVVDQRRLAGAEEADDERRRDLLGLREGHRAVL